MCMLQYSFQDTWSVECAVWDAGTEQHRIPRTSLPEGFVAPHMFFVWRNVMQLDSYDLFTASLRKHCISWNPVRTYQQS
jgi:hypothetical protein